MISDKTRPVPYGVVLPPLLRSAGGSRHRARAHRDPRRHRPASRQHLGRARGDDQPRGGGALPHPQPRRARCQPARPSGAHRARHGDLARPRLRRRRPEGRHRPDRAAPDGRLLGRPQGGGAGLRRRSTRCAACTARRCSSRRSGPASSTAIRSTPSCSTSRAASASTSCATSPSTAAAELTGVFAGDLEARARRRRARSSSSTCAPTSTGRPTS